MLTWASSSDLNALEGKLKACICIDQAFSRESETFLQASEPYLTKLQASSSDLRASASRWEGPGLNRSQYYCT